MQLVKVKYQSQISAGVLVDQRVYLAESSSTPIFDFLEADSFEGALEMVVKEGRSASIEEVRLLPPLDLQEVWAAGVTYIRSKSARMEESETAASCYDRVYESPRPEIFFKATSVDLKMKKGCPMKGLRN